MLTQHNRKTCRLSPDYTFAIRELGVWSGDETMYTMGHYVINLTTLSLPSKGLSEIHKAQLNYTQPQSPGPMTLTQIWDGLVT